MTRILFTPLIYTPSGFARAAIPGVKALDLGCGQRKLPGAVGMDVIRESQADVFHDMNRLPWPFEANSFDLILANHALEHAENVVAVMSEAHRVSRADGHVIIQVPYFRSADAFADPTHKHFFTSSSLDYFIEKSRLYEYRYASFCFRKLGFWYGWPRESRNPLRQFVKSRIHRNPAFYDQYLSLLFPVECLTWELEAIKQ